MDIFSLVGKITINYSDAIDDVEKVSKAAKSTAESLEDVDKRADDAGNSVENAGRAAQNADGGFSTWKATLANLASNAISRAVTACGNLAKSVVDLGTDFTSTMSEVQSISGASDEQMQQLEATAREFGATTVFSATDAAEALKYMSLAGWSVEESTSGLSGVLDLAAASGMELGKASDMVTDYLSAFCMEEKQSAYFADVLAYAQANSNTSAEQLGEAYRNCAANLNAAGQDMETTTSLLEAMANQGYKGSEAGTALAAIMRDITNAMDDGKIKIGDTTVAVTDASGNFRDLTDILTDVQNATNGMGDAQRVAALSSTFTADSTKGLNLILNEGMENIAGYEDALRDSNGAASEMAATMNDNLKGDLANLNSAFEELKLKIFDGAESPMRSVVQFTTDKVIPVLTKLIENMDTVGPVVLGVATAFVTLKTGMAISSLITAATKAWTAYKTANEGATVAQWLFNAALNANPMILVVSLIAGLVIALVTLWNTNEKVRNALTSGWNKIKNVCSAATKAVSGFFSDMGTKIKNTWKDVKTATSQKASEIKQGVIETFSQMKENMGTIMQAARDTVNQKLTNIRQAYEEHGGGIKGITAGTMEAIKGYYTSGLTFVDNLTGGKLSAVADKFRTKMSESSSTAQAKLNEIKNWFSSGLGNAYSTASSTLSNIHNAFSSKMNAARDTVKAAIDKIRSFFNFSWSLPKLKMPHISISGKFSLKPPSAPHFSVEWYKKAMDDGMIMNQPTIFGYNPKSGSFLGGGEAGSETVVGTGSLLTMIREAVSRSNEELADETRKVLDMLQQYLPYLPQLANMQLVTDTGVLAGELAPAMNDELGKIFDKEGR